MKIRIDENIKGDEGIIYIIRKKICKIIRDNIY